MKKNLILIFAFFCIIPIYAQFRVENSDGSLKALKKRKELYKKSLFKNLSFESVGPTVMSARVTDLEVYENDPKIFYVSYASGGLWKTENNGITFKPLFDNEAVMTIGDIAVDWKNGETIWIGTGENNSSRSSYAGVGIYKSEDKGKTWQHLGLSETHHIGSIILHPNDKNIVWVAAIGHLYSANKERGVFKTTDGGKTWKKVLFIDENTGAIDMIINPKNADELFVSVWKRERRSWNFTESGETSGIYKTKDGGENWFKISGKESGFPQGNGIGRIGLTIFPKDPKILYAFLDNQNRKKRTEKNKEISEDLKKELFQTISKEDFLKLEDKKIDVFLKKNNFPEKYNSKIIKEKVKNNILKPISLYEYLIDSNDQLFDTPIIGAEIYRSDDSGKTWKKTHEDFLDDVIYTYGYYFGEIEISNENPDKIYFAGVPFLISEDGGKNFYAINHDNVHVDFQSIWVNPKDDKHIICGNDGGVNISYDMGKNWFKANSPAVGQLYSVNYDMDEPYNIYGGLQDNGVWCASHVYKKGKSWQNSGHYHYKEIMEGDGMQIAVDTRDNTTVYTGYQFGHYYKVNRKTGEYLKYIHPKHKLGEKPLRFNWQSPIKISQHNQDIIYFGSNKFHRSMDKCENFETLSKDLTQGEKKGNVSYGTLTTISESPLRFGLIYVGSDDGLIQVSKNGGYDWENITNNLPKNLWVSRVIASKYDKKKVFVSLNGYRNDDFNSYLFVSNDFGKTWKSLSSDLPAESINVIKEDPKNENILYVGTDHALYVSINNGEDFMLMNNNLPAAAVHDLVIHPRDNDLIVGTHGRSIYIANVEHLQKITNEIIKKEIFIFEIPEIKKQGNWGNKEWSKWLGFFEPKQEFVFYANKDGNAKIKIETEDNLILNEINFDFKKGLNYVNYDLTIMEKFKKNLKKDKKNFFIKKSDNGKFYIPEGKYFLKIENQKIVFEVK